MASFVERRAFEYALNHPWFFRHVVRPELYRRYGKHTDADGVIRYDPEDVHDAVMRHLPEFKDIIVRNSNVDRFPELETEIKGVRMLPFGTAAGMDKNCMALDEFSHVFGFQKPGTMIVPKRDGNKRPRVAVDERKEDAYNAQGFPFEGFDVVFPRLKAHRQSHADTVIYGSVCGLPAETDINRAYEELELLATELSPYVDGIEWNPFSPNTASLQRLRTPEVFRESARLIRRILGERLLLVKMGPYEESGKKEWLGLVKAFLDGGGDGVTATNTYMVKREDVPSEWGYTSAGRSGRFLSPYRMRAVKDARSAFPSAVIFAAGGIFDAYDAYETFVAGADALEGYTHYVFYGLGLARQMMKGVGRRLKEEGYRSLEEMKADQCDGAIY